MSEFLDYDGLVYYHGKVRNEFAGANLLTSLKKVSGLIVSIPDGMEKLPFRKVLAHINPVQDLNGYDNPWPSGGGKNKLDIAGISSGSSNGITFTKNSDGSWKAVDTATATATYVVGAVTLKANTSYAISGCPSGGGLDTFRLDVRTDPGGEVIGEFIDNGEGNSYTPTADTPVKVYIRIANGYACPTGGLTFYPMIRLSSDTATFAPPENICPITGWTGANIVKSGTNIWDEQWELGTFSGGQLSDSTTRIRNKYPIPVNPNCTYFLSFPRSTYVMQVNKKTSWTQYTSEIKGSLFKPEPWAKYIYISPVAEYGATYLNDISLNYPSTIQSYVPHTGNNEYPIAFVDGNDDPLMVYGGTLDVTTGVLTVDKAIVDMGSLSYTYDSTNDFFHVTPSGIGAPLASIAEEVCSTYKINAGISDSAMATAETGIYLVLSNGKHKIKDTRYSSGSDLATALTGQKLIYPLDTPTTYNLTPQEIAMLLGENNVWADTGNTEVTYGAYLTALQEQINALANG